MFTNFFQKARSKSKQFIKNRVFQRAPTYFEYKGYSIPEHLINLTGGGSQDWGAMGQAHIDAYNKVVRLRPDMSILEVGCGVGRDAMPFSEILSSEGSYLGVDIVKDSIDWCSQNITPLHTNFRFEHFDVRDQLHNPQGTMKTTDIRLPLEDSSVDFICLQSVFTHMYEKDISHYLEEFKRVLSPSGLVYATMFVISPDVLQSSRAKNLTPFDLRFEHEITEGIYINDPVYPLGAIGFSKEKILQIVKSGGLRFKRDILPGAWSGLYADPHHGQDVVLLVH